MLEESMYRIDQHFNLNIINSITCPLSNTPFKNAQMVNCDNQHSFSLENIESIFGKMQNDQCEKPGLCPLCQPLSEKKVTAYYPNPSLQNLVDLLIKARVDISIDNTVITRKLKMKHENNPPYPLEKAYFKVIHSFFLENALRISLENQLASSQLKTLNFFFISIEKIENTLNCTLRVFLKNLNSLNQLSEYLKLKEIRSIQTLECKEIVEWTGQNYQEFINCIDLLVSTNRFDFSTQMLMQEFIDKCHLLISSIKT